MTELILDLVCLYSGRYLLLIFIFLSSQVQMTRKVVESQRENQVAMMLLSFTMVRVDPPPQRVEEAEDVVHNNLLFLTQFNQY